MKSEVRQRKILDILRNDEIVEVDALSERFEVTAQTVRNDLRALSAVGLVERVHGGAQRVESVANQEYAERRNLMRTEKQKIANIAAGLIPDKCSIMLNIGTSTEQVAKALRGHRELLVLSNNVNIINLLTGSGSKELVLVGGTVRQGDGAIVGESAVEFIGGFKADFAIIGASALDDDGAILDFDAREVSVARAMLRNARTRILVCDSSKFRRTAPVRICELEKLDFVVTDKEPSQEFKAAASQAEVQILFPDLGGIDG